MDWVRFLDGDDFRPPSHTHRADAFARIVGAVADGARTFEVAPGPDLRAINGAVGMLRALTAEGWGTVRPHPGGRSAQVVLTMAGRRLAVQSQSGGIVLFPVHGPTKVVPSPPHLADGDDLETRAGAVLIAVYAPEWFDEDVRAGSEDPVLLDPVEEWATHPVYAARHGGPDVVDRAWEVFSLDGESHGLLLLTERGFVGVECGGPVSSAPTAGSTVWEIVVNK